MPLPRSVLQRISPGTAQFYDRLLPAQPEALNDAGPAADVHAAAGGTISLYPQATRRMLLRILAVFALFSAVRNNLEPAGALRRLGIAALVNGALRSWLFRRPGHNDLLAYNPLTAHLATLWNGEARQDSRIFLAYSPRHTSACAMRFRPAARPAVPLSAEMPCIGTMGTP